MARIRYIKPSFFDHEGLATVSAYARLAFQGLWLHADREGRLKDTPTRLRVRIFPYESALDFNLFISELESIGVVVRYVVEGERYLFLPGFSEHQRPHPKEPISTLPPCPATEKHGKKFLPTAGNAPIPPTTVGMGMGIGNGNRDGDARTRTAPLITSPLQYEKRKSQCAFVGSRLEVPHGLHGELRKLLGGANAEFELQGWYTDLNIEIEDSGESITPDIFKWLHARYGQWRKVTSDGQDEAELLARLQAIEDGTAKR